MELYQAHDHYILLDGEHSLWCSRFDGKLTARTGEDLCRAWNPVCLGLVHGVIGKVQLYPDSEWHLLLVTKKMSVGVLPGGHEVYKISRVVILPLSPVEPPEMELEWCRKHHFGISNLEKIAAPLDSQQRALAKTWNSIKSVAVPKKKRDIKEKEKLERRVFEELNKMFSDSDSFYYSPTGDLTNSVQRQHSKLYDTTSPLWRKVDPRFFWNTHMLNDLIQSEDPLSDRWIVPVIQGYVQMERFQVMLGEEDRPSDEGMEMTSEGRNFTITLISRRSRHRAGTRYKRRGVDETGACANFVETEQIIQVQSHVVSFVQVRGSVPIFWSQPGIRYRPPPRIDRGEVETQAAFEKHFEEQFDTYGSQVVANLVDQVGREKVIGDAFLTHILNLDSPKLTYITFDFHEHCRGMKFENVCVLVDSIKDLIRAMRYSWVDPAGVICEQQGVFRTNCMDCLDRTNVVQSAIARTVMEIQLRKLGLMMPDQTLPSRCRVVYQQMWANNGDAISRQYAGTAAMKGDFTRTGERKLAGVLNDGYKSANRYYLSRFKDAYRQATIDMMLGNAVSEDLTVLQSSGREEELLLEEREDHVAQLIEHCKQLLLPGAEGCAGGWALIDCDPGSQLLEERLSQALEEEARADLSRLLPSTRTLNTNDTKAKSRSLNNLASDLEVVKENKAKVQLPEQDGRKVQTEPGSSALTQTSLLSTISQDALSSLRPPESLQKLQDMIKQQFSEVPLRLQKYVQTVGQSVTEETSQQDKDKSERNGQETKDDIRGGVGQADAIVAENNQMVQNVGCEDVLNLGYQTVNKSLKDLIPQNFRQQVSKLPDKMQQLISQSQETLGEVMFGGDQSEDTSSKDSAEEQADDQGSLLGQVKRLLPLSGGSGTAGDGDLSQPDMDVILLLTQRAYYIAYYDEEAEKVTHYQRVNLEDLEKIELGPEPSVFKSRYYCMRVHHQYCGEVGYFHTLRSIGRGDDQSKGLLQAIADAFRAACEAEGHQIQVAEGKLDKRQTKPHEEIISISAQTRLSAWARTRFPRDHSADSISTVATVSQPTTRSFILSSVRNKISSFNPIRRVRAHTHARRVSLSKKSGGGIVYFQKGEESAGQADDEGANMSVRVTLSDSSSETESFDNLSLDDCEAILASCGQNNNKRKSLQELIVTEADDLVLESCGILASSPPSSHTRIHIMAGKGEEGTQGEDYTTPQTASDLDTDIRTMTSVAIKVVAPQEEENGAQQQDGNKVEDGLPTPESQSCQSTPQKQQQQPDAGATDSKTPDREDSKKNTILEFFKPARKIFELSLSVDSKFSSSPTGAGAEDDRVVDGESKEEAEELSQTGEEEEIQGDRGSTEEQNLAITAVPQSESTSPLATDSETPGKLGVEEPVAVNSIAEPNASAENTDFIKLSPLTKFRSLFSPSDRDASPRRNGDRQQNRQVESLELRLKMKNCKTQIIQL
ncbi:PREDICTED: phosphatidylinositide phosphatase SAC2-like isoform X1 [Branchiostoma belcheri]|uniref:Phosphatidylinositide phosphatase SAC2-like isoform X1 n=2 Tax=Branchiostoma belcheri TaxID=7741 RepID=A0A6P4ZWG2_BRABE|nr:PREDICTED: phosphatidylinositide phosphatase SAC2-like isoform X1 [Branchiostoma belcheri]